MARVGFWATVALCLAAGLVLAAGAQEPDIFEPTNEWREVLDHQQVPGGLAIRMDLAEGKKYAKLLDKAPTTGGALALVPDATTPEHVAEAEVHVDGETGGVLAGTEEAVPAPDTTDDIERILASLPAPDESFRSLLAQRESLSRGELAAKLQAMWEGRQAELQEAMSSMVTEAQQMADLLTRLLAPGAPLADRESILEDLAYYLGKADNARDFTGMGGVEALAFALNDTLPRIRAGAAMALGTAVRYESSVQGAAHAAGVVPALLGNIRRAAASVQAASRELRAGGGVGGDSAQATVFRDEAAVLSRSLFALGAQVRGHAPSQRDMVGGGGAEALTSVLGLLSPPSVLGGGGWSPAAWYAAPDAVAGPLMRVAAKAAVVLADAVEEGGGSDPTPPPDTAVPTTGAGHSSAPEVTTLDDAAEIQRSHRSSAGAGVGVEAPPTPHDMPTAGLATEALCDAAGEALAVCLAPRDAPGLPCPHALQEGLLRALAQAYGAHASALYRLGRDTSPDVTLGMSAGPFHAPQCSLGPAGQDAPAWRQGLQRALQAASADVEGGGHQVLAARSDFAEPVAVLRALAVVAQAAGLPHAVAQE